MSGAIPTSCAAATTTSGLIVRVAIPPAVSPALSSFRPAEHPLDGGSVELVEIGVLAWHRVRIRVPAGMEYGSGRRGLGSSGDRCTELLLWR
jgi:hypothetical protein